jgi:hypothetical protein
MVQPPAPAAPRNLIVNLLPHTGEPAADLALAGLLLLLVAGASTAGGLALMRRTNPRR